MYFVLVKPKHSLINLLVNEPLKKKKNNNRTIFVKLHVLMRKGDTRQLIFNNISLCDIQFSQCILAVFALFLDHKKFTAKQQIGLITKTPKP